MTDKEIISKTIFNKMSLSEEEIDYIARLAEADNLQHNMPFLQKKIASSIFYLAKQIEACDKSNQKNANRMFWLTLAIGTFGFIQLAELFLKLSHVIN